MNKNNKYLTYLILVAAILVVVLYAQQGKLSNQVVQPLNQVTEEDEVLNCAKKVNQDEIAMASSDSDCLFIGCSNFFE